MITIPCTAQGEHKNSKNKSRSKSRRGLSWYFKAPARALKSMRDSYENGMVRCAESVRIGTLATSYTSGGGARRLRPLKRGPEDEDRWELIRDLSQPKIVVVIRSQGASEKAVDGGGGKLGMHMRRELETVAE